MHKNVQLLKTIMQKNTQVINIVYDNQVTITKIGLNWFVLCVFRKPFTFFQCSFDLCFQSKKITIFIFLILFELALLKMNFQ